MPDNSQRLPKDRGRVLSTPNMVIDGFNIMKGATGTTPVNPDFGFVAILLAMIRVGFFLPHNRMSQAHASSGHDGQRTGLC